MEGTTPVVSPSGHPGSSSLRLRSVPSTLRSRTIPVIPRAKVRTQSAIQVISNFVLMFSLIDMSEDRNRKRRAEYTEIRGLLILITWNLYLMYVIIQQNHASASMRRSVVALARGKEGGRPTHGRAVSNNSHWIRQFSCLELCQDCSIDALFCKICLGENIRSCSMCVMLSNIKVLSIRS